MLSCTLQRAQNVQTADASFSAGSAQRRTSASGGAVATEGSAGPVTKNLEVGL